MQTHFDGSLHNSGYQTELQLPNRKHEMAIRQRVPPEWIADFQRRISKDADGCWRVRGQAANRAGHVHILTPYGYRVYAHRLAWWLANGTIPAGQSVLHRCDVARCVNPDHLFLGTQKDNMHDAVQKGRKRAWGLQKLNAQQVREIRAQAVSGRSQKDIARDFGIARNTVSQIVHRKSWRHLP